MFMDLKQLWIRRLGESAAAHLMDILMSKDPIKDPFKYDLGAHILNEYTKGIYMKPKPGVKKPGRQPKEHFNGTTP